MTPERDAAIGRAFLAAVDELHGLPEDIIRERLWRAVYLRVPCTERELFAVTGRIEELLAWRAEFKRRHGSRLIFGS